MKTLQQQIELNLEVCLSSLRDLSEYHGYIEHLESHCILSKSRDLMLDILRMYPGVEKQMEDENETEESGG
jgi:hypothetical protein